MSRLWPLKPRNYLPPDNSGETFHVLHISDINLQPDYKMFAEANCTQSLCCSPHCRNLQDSAPNFNENLEGGYFDSSYSRNHFEKRIIYGYHQNQNQLETSSTIWRI